MTKNECRRIYREKRRGLTSQQILKLDDLLLIQFQKLDLPYVSCVHTYLALEKENEIDTFHLIQYLKFRNPGMIIAVPKVDFESETFHQVAIDEDTEFIVNKHGIDEPEDDNLIPADQTDLIFVPLLAFDKKGYRVGYGKGFYDKFLSTCRSDIIKIGLSYFPPIEWIGDVNEYDIPLDYCITPEKVYQF
jgi:5-formyltetrahydrofolate cyclo-ligase